nr:DUF4270 domain-containing protein [Niabella ginsengisoli]
MPTELGQDLIPPVDNINTFDTLLDVETYNGIFSSEADSFRSFPAFPKLLGNITNDPIFGKTDARIYFQVSNGGVFPFKNRPGSLYLDSVVLIIDHLQNGTYGDSLTPQTIQVSELDQANEFRGDSVYKVNRQFTATNVLGSKTIIPRTFSDSIQVINYPDTTTVANQLRIKLDNSFGERLLAYDSTGANDGYSSDSLFRTKFKGFALQSIGGGNALMLLDLTSSNSRLAVYYRYNNTTTPTDMDTAVATLAFFQGNASANYINRDYNGTQVTAGSDDLTQDQIVYIQNSPGTFANVKIPELADFQNSVIHLAELQMESIYDASDTLFYAPPNVFLDIYDSTAGKFKLIPSVFGVTQTQTGGYALSGYENFYSSGSALQTFFNITDPFGNRVRQWRFNLTRYAQHLVSDKVPYYMMRLYAPAATSLEMGDQTPIISARFPIPQSSFYGYAGIGRVRIGGGNHPTQRMKLRVVYSKLK